MINKDGIIIDQIISKIKKSERIILVTHSMPDGDALGSLLAMGLILKKLGKAPYLSWSGNLRIPPQYDFLPGQRYIIEEIKMPKKNNLLISLDCANFERLEIFTRREEEPIFIINIDHHVDNPGFGNINWVDPKTASTSILIYKMALKLGVKIDRDIATCLYVGIITDTGSFQYANTNPEALKIAAELLEYKIDVPYINFRIYENISYQYLGLISIILGKSKYIKDKGLIYAVLTKGDLKESGTKIEETENLINFLRSVSGVKVAALIKEIDFEKSYKISLRSKEEIDVSKIANKFGGGGHKKAAGYLSNKKVNEIIDELSMEIP